MGVEIERKFLVHGTAWKQSPSRWLSQGYLSQDGNVTVRVRISDQYGFLTIKSPTQGCRRAEYEYAIPLEEARELLLLCQPALVEKRRYSVVHRGKLWEVDEFAGHNTGLVVAEIELKREDESFDPPEWLGEEVTDDPRYRNSSLVLYPFSQWSELPKSTTSP